jgi:Carboxypeptidase regulatory-like domain
MRVHPGILSGLFAAVLLSQGPPTKGSISGRVVDMDTQAPIGGAKVGSRDIGYSTTDADGKYSIRDVNPGAVTVWVQEANGGYLAMTLTPPRHVRVTAGNDTAGVDFRTRLDARLSGRVFDAEGNPLAGVAVSIIERQYRSGLLSGNQVLGDSEANYELDSGVPRNWVTDDRGVYTIDASVFAGRKYWILARLPRRYAGAISDAPDDPQARKPALVPTYYPSATSIASAVPLVLHSLERRENVDIRMTRAPAFCLDATLTEFGTPASLGFGLLEEELYNMTNPMRIVGQAGSDGRIRVCDLYPGEFRLDAIGTGLPRVPQSFGEQRVTISNSDLKGVRIDASPPMKIRGEIVWDKPPTESNSSTMIRVTQRPAYGPNFDSSSTLPASFAVDAFRSLSYGLIVAGRGSFYVKDLSYEGTSIMGKPLVAGNAAAVIRVVLASDGGTIKASTNAPGVTVFLLSATAQPEAELARTVVAGLTDDSGTFVARALPPGRYYVVATNDPPPGRVLLPSETFSLEKTPEAIELLLATRSRGELVTVGAGATAEISVTPKVLR